MPSLERILMGGFTMPVADVDDVLVAVAVDGKSTCLCLAVCCSPKHQVPVHFVEAILGVKKCGPKATIRHIAQAGNVISFARVHCPNDGH